MPAGKGTYGKKRGRPAKKGKGKKKRGNSMEIFEKRGMVLKSRRSAALTKMHGEEIRGSKRRKPSTDQQTPVLSSKSPGKKKI